MFVCVCVCVFMWSGGSDCRAPAEAQQDLLTVLQGPTVSDPLQGALGLGQQAGAVPRWGQQGHGQVAAGQKDGMSPLPLAQDAFTF